MNSGGGGSKSIIHDDSSLSSIGKQRIKDLTFFVHPGDQMHISPAKIHKGSEARAADEAYGSELAYGSARRTVSNALRAVSYGSTGRRATPS